MVFVKNNLDSLPKLSENSYFTGIEETLGHYKASWHKSCYNKCNSLKLQRAQKRKRESVEESSTESTEDPIVIGSPPKTRRKAPSESTNKCKNTLTCFFCDSTEGELHKAETMTINTNVQSAARMLQDWKLMAKLADGDMHARDAFYHKACLTSLYNRQRRFLQKQLQDSSAKGNNENEITPEAIALAELIAYINESVATGEAVFKMSHLAKLYSSRLEKLGVEVTGRVNSTRLKERLLTQFPELHAFTDGKDVKLAMSSDIGTAMAFVHDNNSDTAAMCLAKAATIVRKEMFMKTQAFDGTFTPDCQQQAVPDSLLALVNMILEGPNISNQNDQEVSGASASLTISQLLLFNSVRHTRSGASNVIRHNKSRETPLSTYTALVIHAETRKKTLVDKFYKLGLCISYDRLMQISSDLGNKICKLYEKEGVVCPPKLRKNVFTTASVDNIDHNPSSRTAKDSFHGTAISITQHPSADSQGQEREQVSQQDYTLTKSKIVNNLPEFYTTITPVTDGSKKDIFCPKVTGSYKPKEDMLSKSITEEQAWLERVEKLLEKEKLEEKEYLSWSAYFASVQQSVLRPNAITSLLPLFEENAHTMAMIQHAMKTVKDSTKHLNPRQTPVIAMDQPLYALAKQIQWNNKEEFGEDKYMVMMGGLHIEMATLKMIGHWLSDSGWARYGVLLFYPSDYFFNEKVGADMFDTLVKHDFDQNVSKRWKPNIV